MARRGEARLNQAMTAALIGGTAAATAGAFWSARAIARRNGANGGDVKLNPVMENAATACELAHGEGTLQPSPSSALD
jgi:hypothetical protein